MLWNDFLRLIWLIIWYMNLLLVACSRLKIQKKYRKGSACTRQLAKVYSVATKENNQVGEYRSFKLLKPAYPRAISISTWGVGSAVSLDIWEKNQKHFLNASSLLLQFILTQLIVSFFFFRIGMFVLKLFS